MLGVPLETFRGNKIVMAVAALVAAGIAWGFVEACADEGAACWMWMAVVLAPLGFLVYWLSSVEIIIHDGGISSKTCLGTKEMRWDDVTRFTYTATRQSVNFIPVGTYYQLNLEGQPGQKIRIGNRASGMEKLSTQLLQHTLPPLVRRAVEQFNSGLEVDFGSIRLSREGGFKSKGLFKTIEVPLDQVVDYRIEGGHFYVFRQGKKFAAISAPLAQVPNAFALLALLDSLFQRTPSPPAGS